MNRKELMQGYRGGYLIGFLMIGVVALRALLFYRGHSNLALIIFLIAMYMVLYSLEPWLSPRFHWFVYLYFPLQTAFVIILSNLQPFLDFQTVLYFPLSIQVFRRFSLRAATAWTVFFVILLCITLLLGLEWWEGLALILLDLAMGTFLLSYDSLYSRIQADQAERQRLLANLQAAHRELQEQAAQVEELAAARERNQLARELHDSVSQAIFSISLTSQSARLLLERDPTRVLEELQRLQELTSSALDQLRSLIAQLHPR